MDALERLMIVREIQALQARYFRALDGKDWDGFGAIFTTDCRFAAARTPEDLNPEPRFGRATIVKSVRRNVGRALTVHQGCMPEIEVLSPIAAKGVWAMSDIVEFADGKPFKRLSGAGHYHETYVLEGGRWMINSLRLSRLCVTIEDHCRGEKDDA
jgi:hypothetical protein